MPIKVITNEVKNFETRGFDASIDGMTISVTAGSLVDFVQKEDPEKPNEVLWEEVKTDFPEFSFDVVPDTDSDGVTLNVVYRGYLTETPVRKNPNVEVERTEETEENIPNYTGSNRLVYNLLSLSIPPNETSLDNVDVEIYHITRTKE